MQVPESAGIPGERVRIGGLDFDLWQDGDPAGQAILMLHGFPADHTCWDSWIKPLVRAGYRPIRPDQRGYSPGARPREIEAYRLGVLVDDALGMLDALGVDQAHVLGHDWGGAVAWALASRHPDRLASLTVLSTPHPRAFLAALGSSRQLAMSWYMGLLQWPDLAHRAVAPGGPAWPRLMRGLPIPVRDHYASRARDPQAFRAMIAWYRAMALDAIRPSVPWEPIVVPTLYAWGMRDPALGAAAARLTAAEVEASYEFIALVRHGHWLPERAAHLLLAKVIEHLAANAMHTRP